MIAYLQLFNVDAAFIAFLSYLIGAKLAGSAQWRDVGVAVLITGISTNFIYSFNSWADCHIDAVNKPWRPIPSRRVTARNALVYSLVLCVMAIIYPFFIARDVLTLFLFQLLPLLGLLYSSKPTSFRKYSILSTLTISLGLITPLMLGYFMNTTETGLLSLFFGLFIYCLSVVPLKDIEDAEGDQAFGVSNLYFRYGNKLLLFSLAGLAANLIWFRVVSLPQTLQTFITIIIIATITCILVFQYGQLNTKKLYRTIIRMVITLAIIMNVLIR